MCHQTRSVSKYEQKSNACDVHCIHAYDSAAVEAMHLLAIYRPSERVHSTAYITQLFDFILIHILKMHIKIDEPYKQGWK